MLSTTTMNSTVNYILWIGDEDDEYGDNWKLELALESCTYDEKRDIWYVKPMYSEKLVLDARYIGDENDADFNAPLAFVEKVFYDYSDTVVKLIFDKKDIYNNLNRYK